MGLQRAFRVAVDGKLPVYKSFADTFRHARRLAFAAAAFFVTSTAIAHAQAGGPFADGIATRALPVARAWAALERRGCLDKLQGRK